MIIHIPGASKYYFLYLTVSFIITIEIKKYNSAVIRTRLFLISRCMTEVSVAKLSFLRDFTAPCRLHQLQCSDCAHL